MKGSRVTVRTTTPRIGRAILFAVAVALVGILSAGGQAHAAQNDLAFRGCDTGKTTVSACAPTSDATLGGANSGLAGALDIAVSPDGEHVYTDSQSDTSIAWFNRDPATGALTYTDGDCISGETTLTGVCGIIATATGDGENSGLQFPDDLALSANGEFLYAAAQGDDAIAVFDRDTSSGDLTFLECITGKQAAGSAGSNACDDSSAPQTGGANSGLDLVSDLAVTANSVYAVSPLDDSVVRVERNQMTGSLSSFSCHSTEIASGPVPGGGTGACAAIGTPAANGASTGLDSPFAIEVSGGSVYAASTLDAAITRFSRDMTGALTYGDCLTGEQETNVCVDNDTVTPAGSESGLHALTDLASSPNNESLYAISGGDAAISHFDRDTMNGALDFQQCVTAEAESDPPCTSITGATSLAIDSGLDGLAAAAIAEDGESLYTAAPDDDAVAHFERDPLTGSLAYGGCLTAQTESGPPCVEITGATAGGANTGLDGTGELVTTGDGESVYAVAGFDSAVAHFNRETPPDTQIDSGPVGTTSDSTPSFTFSVPPPGDPTLDLFQCGVDGPAVDDCSDPDGSHTTDPLTDGPHTFTVRAVDTFGFADATPATSAFTVDAVPDPPPPGPPSAPTPDPQPGDADPPETTVTKQPKKRVETEKAKKKAKFEFASDEAGSSFECEVDDKGFAPCTSPFTKKVKAGKKHTFEVRATDAVGNVDPTPSVATWKVKQT
jgi:6-phosphogluconolactonase (cycloisomerase 2 family)